MATNNAQFEIQILLGGVRFAGMDWNGLEWNGFEFQVQFLCLLRNVIEIGM